jgi:hypothetical protein
MKPLPYLKSFLVAALHRRNIVPHDRHPRDRWISIDLLTQSFDITPKSRPTILL